MQPHLQPPASSTIESHIYDSTCLQAASYALVISSVVILQDEGGRCLQSMESAAAAPGYVDYGGVSSPAAVRSV